MTTLIERALGMTGAELRRAFPLFAYLFLTMASSVASKAARDALFLDRYRAIDLPYVDIAIAALVGVGGEPLHPGRPPHQPAQPAGRPACCSSRSTR